MNRWNIVREKRKDLELLEKKEERKCLFKFWWIRQYFTHMGCQTIHSIYDHTLTQILKAYKEKLCVMRIIRKFRKQASRKGETLNDRNMNSLRM